MRFKVLAVLLISLVQSKASHAESSITTTSTTTLSESNKDVLSKESSLFLSSSAAAPKFSSSKEWSCKDLDFCDDQFGFDAIRWLHWQLDDDQNGKVDMTESADFFRHDLNHADTNERQRQFHGNDKHISVDEMWRHWLKSEVHNWTVDQTIDWLTNCVKLEQYVDLFRQQQVNGAKLAR